MHGLSTPGSPVPLTTLSTKEYYHLAGFNRTSQKRQEKKRRDFNQNIFQYFPNQRLDNTIQGLESTLPSPKTARVNIFFHYLVCSLIGMKFSWIIILIHASNIENFGIIEEDKRLFQRFLR
jgi:hypothetical protein